MTFRDGSEYDNRVHYLGAELRARFSSHLDRELLCECIIESQRGKGRYLWAIINDISPGEAGRGLSRRNDSFRARSTAHAESLAFIESLRAQVGEEQWNRTNSNAATLASNAVAVYVDDILVSGHVHQESSEGNSTADSGAPTTIWSAGSGASPTAISPVWIDTVTAAQHVHDDAESDGEPSQDEQ